MNSGIISDAWLDKFLKEFDNIILKGKFKEAKQLIDEFKNKGKDNDKLYHLSLLLESYWHIRKGNYKNGLSTLDMFQEALPEEEIADRITLRLFALFWDFSGLIAIRGSNCKDARESIEKGISLLESNEIQCPELGTLYNDFANHFICIGNLNEAKKFLLKAIEVYQKFGVKLRMGHAYANLSTVHLQLYNFDKAEEFALKSEKLFKETKAFQDLSYAYRNLGKIYAYRNKSRNALKYHTKSLKLRKRFGTAGEKIESLYYLLYTILIFDLKEEKKKEAYWKEFQELVKNNENTKSKALLHLLQGLFLKKSNELQKMFSSAEYFKKVLELPYQSLEFVYTSLTNLIELDLLELKAMPYRKDILKELQGYFQQLEKLSKEKENKELNLIQAIMQSRFLMMQKKYNEALNILEKAKRQLNTEDGGLISKRLQDEFDKLFDKIQNWEEGVSKSQEMLNRLANEELINYIRIAANVTKSI